MPKNEQYSLTKAEIDKIAGILNVMAIFDVITEALGLSFKNYLIETVFSRCNLDVKRFEKAQVNIAEGIVSFPPEEKPKANDKTSNKTKN